MKLIFLCGSLEPGRDGVGDYSRRLASELIRKSHHVAIVALNDKVSSAVYQGIQSSNGIDIPILRLPASMAEKERFSLAGEFIRKFEPEWLSLQYVPFSFEKRGLPLSFTRHLKSLDGNVKWHFMFHELWVGIYGHTNLKLKMLGLMQKLIIKQTISAIKPESVTTSISIYKKSLGRKKVALLPLFSNIPVVGIKQEGNKATDYITAIHFGTFTGALADYKKQIAFLKASGEKLGKTVCLEIIGNGGHYKEKALEISRNILGEQYVTDCGFLSEEAISHHLLKADIGISRADYTLFGKSGSAMAMLEHGLPLLLRGNRPTEDILGNDFPFREQLVYPDDPLREFRKKEPVYFIGKVAETFVESLTEKQHNQPVLITM